MEVFYIGQSAELINWTNGIPSQVVAMSARVCTDSQQKLGDYSACRALCRKLLDWGHMTPFEFFEVTFAITTSRAVSHQIVRHRLASYMQESQRYCDYSEALYVIQPKNIARSKVDIREAWQKSVEQSAETYAALTAAGYRPEDARSVLPEATATKLYCKMNLREFRHFLDLRMSKSAWCEMQDLAKAMLDAFTYKFPDELYLISRVLEG